MRAFDYARAGSIDEALAEHGADADVAWVAGGTTLIDLIKLDVMQPARVVDVNRLPLAKIERSDDGGLLIGAMVRNSDLAWDTHVREHYTVLSEALLAGASGQLRNMASTGGNLMQRTRCQYFRDNVSACNKREPGSGCAAMDGYNRIHAVLGTSDHCIATHASDMCVAMAALEATILVQGAKARREIAFEDFHLLPGDTPHKETMLEPGELITHVRLPPPPTGARSHYLKLRDRASYEFALASAAVVLAVADGKISHVRIALGGVATKPWRAHEAEAALTGKAPGTQVFETAAKAALADARPREHNAFKIELARQAIVRALTRASA